MNEHIEEMERVDSHAPVAQRHREHEPIQRIQCSQLDLARYRLAGPRVRIPEREMMAMPLLTLRLEPRKQLASIVGSFKPGVLRSESEPPEEQHRHQEQEHGDAHPQ